MPTTTPLDQSTPYPFQSVTTYGDNQAVIINDMSDFFPRLIEAILSFLNTHRPAVPKEQTLEVVALVEAGVKALDTRDRWAELPR